MSCEQSLTVAATKEIQSKLQKVSELIATDAEKICKQEKIIENQRTIIEKQQAVISHVREELIEMKKQLLINEAKSTPKDFRDNLCKYLFSLREELVKLEHVNESGNKTAMITLLNEKEEKKDNNMDNDINNNITPNIRSALYIAAGIAIENNRSDKIRLFSDKYANMFASSNNNSGYNFISLFSDALTQINNNEVTADYLSMFVAFRTKWIDDSIYYSLNIDKKRMRDGLTKGTIKQIVCIGVGFDTRSFRLTKLPKDLLIYNIDTIDIINYRKSILKNDLGVCKCIDIDYDIFSNNNWINKLYKSGFNPNKKSIFVCEGILEYFEYNQFQLLLKQISNNSCNGSWLIGECPNKCNIQLKQMHDIWVNLGGQRVLTGIDTPKNQILDKFGFKQFQHVNTLGTFDSNYKNRSPNSYVKYQTATKPIKNDKITRIQLFRGMK